MNRLTGYLIEDDSNWKCIEYYTLTQVDFIIYFPVKSICYSCSDHCEELSIASFGVLRTI